MSVKNLIRKISKKTTVEKEKEYHPAVKQHPKKRSGEGITFESKTSREIKKTPR